MQANPGNIITKRGPMPNGVEPLHYAIELMEKQEEDVAAMEVRLAKTEDTLDPEKSELLKQLRLQQDEIKEMQAWARGWDARLGTGDKLIPSVDGTFNKQELEREFGLYLLDIANAKKGGEIGRFGSEAFKREQLVGTSNEGGYLVRPETFPGVHELAEQYGTARKVLSVFQINSNDFRIPTLVGRPVVYFPGENVAPSLQSTATFGRPAISPQRMVAIDKISLELNQYTAGFIGTYLTKVFMVAVTKAEDYLAFAAKNTSDGGTDPFSGLLEMGTGPSEFILGGGSTSGRTTYASMTYNDVLDLMDTPNPHVFTQNPQFVWSNSINLAIRKLVGTDGQPLAAQMQQGNPPRLFDQLVYRSEVMPRQRDGSQANTAFALFGDLTNHAMGISKDFDVAFSDQADFAAGNIVMRVMEWIGFQLLIGEGIARLRTATT